MKMVSLFINADTLTLVLFTALVVLVAVLAIAKFVFWLFNDYIIYVDITFVKRIKR